MGLKAIFAYMAIASIIISFNTVISEDNEVRPYAQTQVDDYERISYSFSFDSPSFNEMIVYDNQYTSISLPGCVMLGKDVGEPAMPVKFIKILLPPAKSVKNIEVNGLSLEIFPLEIDLIEKPIVPYQNPLPIGSTPPTICAFNYERYRSMDNYPSDLFGEDNIGYCRGYTILSLGLNPLQYVPGLGRLTFYPELNVNIDLEDNGFFNSFYRNNKEDEEWVTNLVNNPEIIDRYEITNFPILDYSGGLCSPIDDYDYVIITTTQNNLDHWETNSTTPNNWTSLMDKHLADDGLNCTLVTIQDINNCSDYWKGTALFNDTAAHIREFCKDAYQDWGASYIFIGGDDEWIPAREMKYVFESDVDSDIYWNHLDNSFNEDGDSYWGEEGDSGFDLYAEMYIGRITCDTPQDVSNWMNKSFYYADSVFTDYLDSAAFYGGDTGWSCQGDDFIDFSAIKGTSNWLGPDPNSDGPYPSWLGYQYGFETWNATNPGVEYNLSVKWTAEPPNVGWQGGSDSAAIAGLKNAINNDYVTLLSGIAHANEYYSLDVYYANWESDYHNTKPFFLHDYGCHSGDMDAADDGVLHSMLFHSDTELAFACVYNTCYGWGNLYSTNSSSSLQQKCFWDYFFDTTNNSGSTFNWQLGKAMAFSKDTMAPTINWDYSYGTWRAIIQGCLLFGDPAQRIKPPTLLDHNVGVQTLDIDATNPVKSNITIHVNATVYNSGNNDETNVLVSFRINGAEENSTTIGTFTNQTSQQVSFNWTPSAGSYNVSMNVSSPAVTEDSYTDNERNQTVNVGVFNIDTNELFDTIQESINDTDTLDDHNILVPAGIYPENVSINKNISLAGINKDTTFIDANGISGRTIQIQNRNSVNITQFTVRNGSFCLYVESSSNISITNCAIFNSSVTGICINASENITITDTNISNHSLGVSYTNISYNNILTDNEIFNNNIGIIVNIDCSNNSIYHNNFNNTLNAFDNGTNNPWDNGNLSEYRLRGGNWWENYSGVDLNVDGIGDTSYNISGQNNSKDRYPLINPWAGSLNGTIYVDDDNIAGPWLGTQNNPYQTIQNAIDEVFEGDDIFVYSGTYQEKINIDKTIDLTGADKNSTIIDSNESGTVVTISSDWVNLTGFTIMNAGDMAFSSVNWSIMGDSHNKNITTDYYSGIQVSSNNNKIYDNIVVNNYYGILWLEELNNNNISDNIIYHNFGGGIIIGYSQNNTVKDNIITNHSYYGVDFGYSSFSNIFENNISDCNDGGIRIWDSSDMNVTDNTINNNMFSGIDSPYSSNNNISNNNIIGSYIGIYFYDSSYNNIFNNNISDNSFYGVYQNSYSINNTIYHNNFINNTIHGYDSGTNNWNKSYPIGGNYWDNYTGLDLNGEGIGDSQYNISGGSNVDYYPLINPGPVQKIFVNDDFNSNTPGWGIYCFDSIKDGINNSSNSDTVFVFNGTYNEYNININKSISLIGEDINSTIIDGLNQDYILLVNNDSVEITRFTLQNSDMLLAAIYVSSNYSDIHHNFIKDCDDGIEIDTGGGTTYGYNNISYNKINNSWIGIWILETTHTNIFENNITNADLACIWIEDSQKTSIFNNTLISNNLSFADGVYIFGTSANTTVFGNSITDNLQGISIEDSTYNNIYKNTIKNNSKGVYESDGFNNTIYHNNFINNSQQAYDDSNNSWYNITLLNGNYWDDFDESGEGAWDNNSNGIVDSEYNISGGSNQDKYPLIYKFENYYILSINTVSSVDEGNNFIVTVKTQFNSLVQGAYVTFNSVTKQTNSNGQTTFTAPSVSSDTIFPIYTSKDSYTGDSTNITVKNIESDNGDPPPPAGGDTTAPTAPTNVGCTTPETDNTPSFSWDAATDLSGVAGYYVKIDDGSDIWIGNVTSWTSTSTIEDGTHTFYVKARDASSNENIGNYETCFFIINTIIVAGLPVANAGGPYFGLTFENIFFDGSGSYDTDGTITNYTWNLGDGTIFFGEQVTYTYVNPGLYNITLKVIDNAGLSNNNKTAVTIELDSDGDGWSDLEEVEFNTNKSDPNDSPIDNDGDRLPDEYDEDDDNDGLVDHLEETWGSDPYNNSDVIVVDIEGREYYLIDSDKDGIINKFCNPVGRITTVDVTDDGNYLIDMDGDAKWDYIYNPASGEITVYSEEASSDDFPWSLVIIGIVIAIIVIILVLYLTGYRIWFEEN